MLSLTTLSTLHDPDASVPVHTFLHVRSQTARHKEPTLEGNSVLPCLFLSVHLRVGGQPQARCDVLCPRNASESSAGELRPCTEKTQGQHAAFTPHLSLLPIHICLQGLISGLLADFFFRIVVTCRVSGCQLTKWVVCNGLFSVCVCVCECVCVCVSDCLSVCLSVCLSLSLSLSLSLRSFKSLYDRVGRCRSFVLVTSPFCLQTLDELNFVAETLRGIETRAGQTQTLLIREKQKTFPHTAIYLECEHTVQRTMSDYTSTLSLFCCLCSSCCQTKLSASKVGAERLERPIRVDNTKL